MNPSYSRSWCLAALIGLLVFGGCRSVYYSTMERFGVEKRDILADRVEDARDVQQETKEQFADALEEFSALIGFDGEELERLYRRLESRFRASERSAERIKKHNDDIERVAKDLFREWERELDQYQSESLRRQSEVQLNQTKDRYADLITRMRRAEAKIEPVLRAFRDQVLFLKHNLNAQAIASLENEASRVQTDVRDLIREMEAAIDEANAFLENIR